MQITSVHAYEIIASGGYPSVEVTVTLDDGSTGTASVPYGASAGSHEASVLVDKDQTRYNGKGMLQAINNIHQEIAPHILGMDATDQKLVDKTMIDLDGTAQKSRLGGNAILAVSLAVARAAAQAHKKPLYLHIRDIFQTGADFTVLPQPMAVVIEGGKHADNSTDLQEYCFSVLKQGSRAESVRIMLECYHALEKVLQENHLSTNVGNEGAFAPSGLTSNEAPFAYMLQAIERAGYTAGQDVGFSIDAAASEFYKDGMYQLKMENRALSSAEVVEYMRSWLEKYPIVTLEDPLHEDDWSAWQSCKQMCASHNVLLVGDDLTVTNKERLQKAIEMDAISSILIKLNQIGTLSETVETCLLAKQHNMAAIPSHRGGGETNDTAMIDVAVAVGGIFIKVGPTRGERVAKYNRLLAIEREIQQKSA